MARIAIPARSTDGTSSEVFEHFGRCESFTVLDVDDERIISVSVIQNAASGQDQKKPAAFLIDNKVDIVLAGMIGPCEYSVLLDNGVRVFKGAEGTVKDAYESYKAGKLAEVQKPRYCL